VNETQRILALFLVVWIAGLLIGRRRANRAIVADLRAIPAFDLLRHSLRRAAETGRAVFVALGLGGIAGRATADSLAGVEVLDAVARQMAPVGRSPIVAIADPTLLPLAESVVRRPFEMAPQGLRRPATDVRWLTPGAAAYAGGVMGALGGDHVGAAVMVGTFGDEYLLLGEAGVRHRIEQVGGTSNPAVLPFVLATANEPLLGEDIYAAGAYLGGKSWHLGSLWAQDLARWLIVLAVIVAVAVNTWLW
jgi:hypothetical protein